MYLIFDIETIPDLTLWSPPPEQVVTPNPNGNGATITLTNPFPPLHAHRPIVIGYALLDETHKLVELDTFTIGRGTSQPSLFGTPAERNQDNDERELILAFSRKVDTLTRGSQKPLTVVTFNGRGFDLPVLVLRALKYAIPMPWIFRSPDFLTRYKERAHCDVADAIALFGAGRMTSLDTLARMIGLPGKVGVDGADVAGLYERGEIDRVVRYCLADVAQTALLFLRWRAVQFHDMPPQTYIQAEGALRLALMNDPRLAELWGERPAPAASEVA